MHNMTIKQQYMITAVLVL